MLEKVVAALPTIGKIAGSLLTSMFGEDDKVYLSYDLTPESRNDGLTDCEAVFTNQDGQIKVSNHGVSKKKELLVRFPKSDKAEADDCYIAAGEELELNKVFSDHADHDENQLELTAVDLVCETGSSDTTANQRMSYFFYTTCGAYVKTVEGFLQVNLSQGYFSLQVPNPPPFLVTLDSLEIGPANSPSNMAVIHTTTVKKTQQVIHEKLPYRLAEGTECAVRVILQINMGNSLNAAREHSKSLTKPISERTLDIINNGRRVY